MVPEASTGANERAQPSPEPEGRYNAPTSLLSSNTALVPLAQTPQNVSMISQGSEGIRTRVSVDPDGLLSIDAQANAFITRMENVNQDLQSEAD